ncbi:hypothetical protein ACFWF7_11165 [Nocardia sp. NPDC060256]|uniref:hypothetical protein n=1 Tax=unclassified Nocardia TaxID=2637762 RepID=UPI00365380C8
MLTSTRVLAPVLLAASIGVALTLATAPASAEPPTAPELCTAKQERDAEGNRKAINDCYLARAVSASARYKGVPLTEEQKKDKIAFVKPDIGVEAIRNHAGELATLASIVTCRIAARAGGALCIPDWNACVKDKDEHECEILAGRRPDSTKNEDSIEDDKPADDALPAPMRKAKETAIRAAKAAGRLGLHSDAEDRIAANDAEAAAVTAARAMKWVN